MAGRCHVFASGREGSGIFAAVLNAAPGGGVRMERLADVGCATRTGKGRLLTGWVSARLPERGRSL